MSAYITVTFGPGQRILMRELPQMGRRLHRALMDGLHEIGDLVQNRIRHSMSSTVRAPWYYVRGGEIRYPSHPLYPPAKQTGLLYNAIQVALTSSYPEGKVSIGPDSSPEAYYAKFLEYGTRKMAKRPFMAPALYHTKDMMVRILQRKINEELARRLQIATANTAALGSYMSRFL